MCVQSSFELANGDLETDTFQVSSATCHPPIAPAMLGSDQGALRGSVGPVQCRHLTT